LLARRCTIKRFFAQSNFFAHSQLILGLLAAIALLSVTSLSLGDTDKALHESTTSAPKDFKAKYEATLAGINIKATSQLNTLENGRRELRFSAKSWVANIEESSQFEWSEQGQLVPLHYEYHRTGFGRDRHAILSFDWAGFKVTNNVQNKPWQMDVPAGALDKLSAQLQLRQDLVNARSLSTYQVADGGKLKTYSYIVLGEEVLETPLGRLNAVKIRREKNSNSKRSTTLWLAKDWDYLLVKLHRQEKDGKQYEINLASGSVAKVAVHGLEEPEQTPEI